MRWEAGGEPGVSQMVAATSPLASEAVSRPLSHLGVCWCVPSKWWKGTTAEIFGYLGQWGMGNPALPRCGAAQGNPALVLWNRHCLEGPDRNRQQEMGPFREEPHAARWRDCCVERRGWFAGRCARSEEHTSELQSLRHLVC